MSKIKYSASLIIIMLINFITSGLALALESKPESNVTVFPLKVGDYQENLPYYSLPSGNGRFVYFNLANNSRLTAASAKEIAKIFPKDKETLFVTPEASTIGLAHELRNDYDIPGLVISKKIRSDMDPNSVIYEEYQPITATAPTRLYLGSEEARKLKGKNIIIVDNVCTTGETIQALYRLIKRAGGKPSYAIVLFTESEGKPFSELKTKEGDVIKLISFGHLPIIQ